MSSVSTSSVPQTQAITGRRPLELPSNLEMARGAMATFLRNCQALQPARTERSPYQALEGDRRVDAFTNEKGLQKSLQRARDAGHAPGGAAVGVSGSILDVASVLRSDFILSVDANPRVVNAIAAHVALLLAADLEARRSGGGDAKRCEVLQAFMDDLRKNGEKLALPAMREVWPDEQRGSLWRSKDALRQSLKASEGHWGVTDFWFTGPEAEGNIAHLAGLARQGRIAAFTANLDEAAPVQTINQELHRRRSSVAAFNLSNVPDYVLDNPAMFRQLGALNLRDDAKLVMSVWGLTAAKRRTSEGYSRALEQETVDLLKKVSTFTDPAVQSAREWLGDSAGAHALHRAFWADYPLRQRLVSARLPDVKPVPDTFEAYVAARR